jgi:serine/threonine protein kinase
LSLQKALFYIEQVCAGLAHAHKCGVIHRDIKPQNLLLTADQQIVKIADFGVARIDAMDGAITRVGTNIYSAPEHNPLMQTGQLDTGGLRVPHVNLTPAADIYSLAKTMYTLLAGESPRRFAQHALTELPHQVSQTPWARSVLRVLEKATQNYPEMRYQTVEEFWDDIADASLPPTRPLQMVPANPNLQPLRRKPSEDLSVEPEDEFTEAAPPRPHFEVPAQREEVVDNIKRPRIVVPISLQTRQQLHERRELDTQPNRRPQRISPPVDSVLPASRKRRALVAVGLILAFSGMLLATHKYVTTRWNPLAPLAQNVEPVVIGKQGITTTDVNLRPVANVSNVPIGLAESGSNVKVLSTDNNWYEIQIVEHARPKTDPYSSDRGWINKRYVRFD